MAKKYVFIITFARSGSTLLQALLNSHDGCYIAGENNNFLFSAYESFKKYANAKEQYGRDGRSRSASHPWYGVRDFDTSKFKLDIKTLVDNALFQKAHSDVVLGFKEIRYPYITDLKDYLLFIKDVFINVHFVFNYRDIEKALSSGFYLDYSEDKLKQERLLLEQFSVKSRSIAKEYFNSCSTILHYEEYIKDHSILVQLLENIGISSDLANIDDILKKPHSYTQSRFKQEN